MKVKDIMHHVDKVESITKVSQAARIMDQKLIGSILVEERGNVIGILTERDILRKVVAKGKDPNTLTAREIMNSPLITIDLNEDIVEASRIMDEKRIRRIIVTEKGRIVGKVTANSISRSLKYLIAAHEPIYTRPEY